MRLKEIPITYEESEDESVDVFQASEASDVVDLDGLDFDALADEADAYADDLDADYNDATDPYIDDRVDAWRMGEAAFVRMLRSRR